MYRSIVIGLLAALSACESIQQSGMDPLGAAPSDFAMELTILSSEDVDAQSDFQFRQSRYVLFADGSLHFGVDSDRAQGADWLPPLRRVLNRRQIAELWSLLQQFGLTDPEAGNLPVNFKFITSRPDEIVCAIAIYGHDDAWQFIRRESIDHQSDQVMKTLVHHLAELAWASEESFAERKTVPKRYDFGPDPYVRYRNQSESN